MAITNGYATLTEAKTHRRITTADASDDGVIELMVEDASRLVDTVTGKWFYAYTQTRYFDVPTSRTLCLDAYLLAVTTLTNGDGTTIASTEYDLLPKNLPARRQLRLKANSTTYWQYSTTTIGELAISIAGSWGYVDRTATDPNSARVINDTRRATLEIFGQWYNERFGNNQSGVATITAAGVVITPYGALPKTAMQILAPYIERI